MIENLRPKEKPCASGWLHLFQKKVSYLVIFMHLWKLFVRNFWISRYPSSYHYYPFKNAKRKVALHNTLGISISSDQRWEFPWLKAGKTQLNVGILRNIPSRKGRKLSVAGQQIYILFQFHFSLFARKKIIQITITHNVMLSCIGLLTRVEPGIWNLGVHWIPKTTKKPQGTSRKIMVKIALDCF